MPLRNIGIVYRKELTEALRDRRTLVSSLLVPLLLFPALTAGFGSVAGYMIDRAKREPPLVMVLGGEDSPLILDYLRKIKDLHVLPAAPDWRQQIAEKKIPLQSRFPGPWRSKSPSRSRTS